MKVEVRITKNFKKKAKPLIKKYSSFLADLEKLEAELTKNPKLGTPLGKNAYKIRLKIDSKGKGKSGDARVISRLESEILGTIETEAEKTIVNLISVYDKSTKASVTDAELKQLIESMEI
ncbi:MAG: addiction module toxin RelE [Acidobacteriota bacterium]|nr:addiction module toxin RelE [Acidobacteriota bacterium]